MGRRQEGTKTKKKRKGEREGKREHKRERKDGECSFHYYLQIPMRLG